MTAFLECWVVAEMLAKGNELEFVSINQLACKINAPK